MEATATVGRGRTSTGVIMMFAAALLAAFLIGGAGGYVVRAWSSTVRTTITTPAPEQHVSTQQPQLPDWAYRRESQPTPPEMLDPAGYPIHI
jgi:hypothetical protein